MAQSESRSISQRQPAKLPVPILFLWQLAGSKAITQDFWQPTNDPGNDIQALAVNANGRVFASAFG